MLRMKQSLFLASILLSGTAALHAQSGLGQITGNVRDVSGSVIAGAAVRARDIGTNVQSQTVTSSDGIYNILSLAPGEYQVTVEKQGFDASITDKVIVSVGQTTTIDAGLKVGSISTKVEVNASAAMLTTSSSDVATTVERSLVANLPFTERNSLEAAMLVPGVRGDPNSPGQVTAENAGIYTGPISPGAATNIAGGMPGATSIMVDGSNVTQGSIGRASISVSSDMVQEVTVVTNGVPAKYGNTGGGVIIQATRSGTNEYHGNFSWRHTDPGFNAYPTGNAIGNKQHQNFFGGYVGGPIVLPKIYNGRNRTFFFGGFEPARIYNATSQLGTIPTPAELAGDFSNSITFLNTTILAQQGLAAALAAPRTGHLYYQSPLNATGFPVGPQYANSTLYIPIAGDNVSAQLKQNKFAQFVLGLQPTPQNPSPNVQFLRPDGLYNNSGQNANLIRGVTNTDDRYSVKVDHNFNDKDRMYARYSVQPLTATRFFGYPVNSPFAGYPTDNASSHVASVNYTRIIHPSMVNELKLLYSRNHQVRSEPASALTQDFGAAYGLTPAISGAGMPKVSWSAYTLAPGSNAVNEQVDTNFQIDDSVNWTVGRHTIAFGLDLRRLLSNQYNAAGIFGGSYGFGPNQTNNGSGGNALASFDLGLVNTYSNTPVPVPGYYRWNYLGGYLQDDIKLRSNLTINIGVRYEFQTPRMEKFGNQGTFLPDMVGSLNGIAAKGAFCFANNCGLGSTLWPSNKKGFEPRIGIAWSPNSRMTVRVNYGLMRVPLTGYGNTPLPDFNVNSFAVGGTTGGVAPNQPVNYLTNPIGPLNSAYTVLQGRGPFFTVQGITVPYIAQTDKVPYIQQWGFTVQTMLTAKTLVQAGYAGTVGHHLISTAAPPLNFPDLNTLFGNIQSGANFSSTTINNPYGIVQNGAVIKENLLSSLNPYQNFFNQPLQQQFYRDGNSNYHALLAGVTQRLAYGLSLQASFTWSKSIDDAGGSPAVALGGSIFGSATVQNPFNLRQERAVSNFDTPVRTTIGYSYQIPVGKAKYLRTNIKAIDNLIGGWVTSGVFNSQSGMPFLVQAGSAGWWVSSTGTSVLPAGVLLRPDMVPGAPCVNPNFSFSNAFNVAYENPGAVAVPGSYLHPAFGSAPRTLTGCRSPWLNSINASLQKRFRLGSNEKRYLQINIDALNAANHTMYFFNPNSGMKAFSAFNSASLTNPSVPAFTQQSTYGELWQPNSALVSRTVFVGAKLYW